jgi:hypothetical protein
MRARQRPEEPVITTVSANGNATRYVHTNDPAVLSEMHGLPVCVYRLGDSRHPIVVLNSRRQQRRWRRHQANVRRRELRHRYLWHERHPHAGRVLWWGMLCTAAALFAKGDVVVTLIHQHFGH